MSTWVASKFNPDTDSDRPKIGSVIKRGEKEYRIEKVEYFKPIDMLSDKEPDKKSFDDVLFKQHSTRPMVIWGVYVKEIKE